MSNDKQKERAKFRRSSKWTAFKRKLKAAYDNKDALTMRPLRAGWAAHHLDLSDENYEVISVDRLVPLSRMSHRLIHYAWQYYKDDEQFIDRLKDILERMKEANK